MKPAQDEIVESVALLLNVIADAQTAAQRLPGNNWPLRRALLECSERAIEAKRRAILATRELRVIA